MVFDVNLWEAQINRCSQFFKYLRKLKLNLIRDSLAKLTTFRDPKTLTLRGYEKWKGSKVGGQTEIPLERTFYNGIKMAKKSFLQQMKYYQLDF